MDAFTFSISAHLLVLTCTLWRVDLSPKEQKAVATNYERVGISFLPGAAYLP
jgi:hypothetical protein